MADMLLGWVASLLDVSAGPETGKSLIELVADNRLLIENHRGVISYETNRVDVKTGFGQISVVGRDLVMACLSKERIVITGQMMSISLFRG